MKGILIAAMFFTSVAYAGPIPNLCPDPLTQISYGHHVVLQEPSEAECERQIEEYRSQRIGQCQGVSGTVIESGCYANSPVESVCEAILKPGAPTTYYGKCTIACCVEL